MKNKIIGIILSAVILAAALTTGALAAKLSPALDVLSEKAELVKAGLLYSDIYYSENDFKQALGVKNLSAITIGALPAPEYGTLKVGTMNVTEGQTIKREYLSVLRFVPASDKVEKASFTFYNGSDADSLEIPCSIYIIPGINYAPAFSENNKSSITTIKDVAYFGNLLATDPERDALSYQVISYPKHATLEITDGKYGSYKYTPAANYTGKDSFTVVARDKFGNYSSAQTISVKVEKSSLASDYVDLDGHWAKNAAIYLTEKSIMNGERVGNDMLFYPDENVSRAEFLTMAMKSLDMSLSFLQNSSFADDGDIPSEFRRYVATAQRMGYINGCDIDGKICFCPNDCISRAEAAVMLNNILELKYEGSIEVFADFSVVPAYAQSALGALSAAGIISGSNGEINPTLTLNRAQAAQILYNISQK